VKALAMTSATILILGSSPLHADTSHRLTASRSAKSTVMLIGRPPAGLGAAA
jgi:hypothetical protein